MINGSKVRNAGCHPNERTYRCLRSFQYFICFHVLFHYPTSGITMRMLLLHYLNQSKYVFTNISDIYIIAIQRTSRIFLLPSLPPNRLIFLSKDPDISRCFPPYFSLSLGESKYSIRMSLYSAYLGEFPIPVFS